VDDRTITQREPGGIVVRITFDPEMAAAVWVYEDAGGVAYATRAGGL
jgi:hypothetical protein